jgi:hypothetical protein
MRSGGHGFLSLWLVGVRGGSRPYELVAGLRRSVAELSGACRTSAAGRGPWSDDSAPVTHQARTAANRWGRRTGCDGSSSSTRTHLWGRRSGDPPRGARTPDAPQPGPRLSSMTVYERTAASSGGAVVGAGTARSVDVPARLRPDDDDRLGGTCRCPSHAANLAAAGAPGPRTRPAQWPHTRSDVADRPLTPPKVAYGVAKDALDQMTADMAFEGVGSPTPAGAVLAAQFCRCLHGLQASESSESNRLEQAAASVPAGPARLELAERRPRRQPRWVAKHSSTTD